MNGNNLVADTSLLVNFFNGLELSKKVMQGHHIWVSCITEIELLSYPKLTRNEEKLIHSFLEECSVIDLLSPIRKLTIDMRKDLGLKIPDAIIAATSVYLDFPLVTMDADFKNIDRLDAIILEY